ncbi:hypothetical protein V3C99_005381 [Haemonchus contortus]|uniref:Conotoxin n=1 Tax=Haemonchus contortus TaxID=6289 RepID=A0A7I5E5G8_HAECO
MERYFSFPLLLLMALVVIVTVIPSANARDRFERSWPRIPG